MEVNTDEIQLQIRLAKEGKQAAFSFLLDFYWNTVYGFLLKRVLNEQEAEDISIETFSKAFDKIHTFDNSYNFSTWLITIAKNLQIDNYRKKSSRLYATTTDTSKQQVQNIPDHSPTAEDELIRQQNLAQLLERIKRLNPEYQKVIHLRYFQEMRYTEIAEHLNEPLSTIKVRIMRARKLLAELITENK